MTNSASKFIPTSACFAKAILYIIISLPGSMILKGQNSITATYTAGLIPTSFDQYDESCNGASATLSLTLPAGETYNITSVDITYSMTGFGSGWKSHQRSKLKLQNTNIEEAVEALGIGNTTGTQVYSRGITTFNGTYGGGTELIFEMKARRTDEGVPGCHNMINRVDANTWTITVNYSNEVENPKLGVNTNSPTQAVDIKGKLKLGDDTTLPQAGTVRWNAEALDFEGYNGTEWMSFTKGYQGSWGTSKISENQGKISSDGITLDFLGCAVAISGEYAVIGANGSNNNQGKAYIFKKTNSFWQEQAILVASDGAAGDYFGNNVTIDGDYVIIGALYKDVGANTNQGRAYVYKRTGSNWIQEAIINSPDGTVDDGFGSSVSISGEYAVIGAQYKKISGNVNQGKAYIFKRSGTTWTHNGSLLATDGAVNDYFGGSASISGIYAAVGARGKLNKQGKVYIYKRTGNAWVLQFEILASDGAANDAFGTLSLSGDYLISGAYAKTSLPDINAGKAYIYKRNGNNWIEQASFFPIDGHNNDYYGLSVSITPDYAVVGSMLMTVNGNNYGGKAYVYKRSGNEWKYETDIFASDSDFNDKFGTSVAIDDNQIVVGASTKTTNNIIAMGKVYFFNK